MEAPWGPKPGRVGPEGWGPEGWEAQNFSLFFFTLPSHFSFILSSLSWGSFRGILVVFEAPGS